MACLIGTTFTPGESMRRKNMVRPLCLGTSGSVRVMSRPQSEFRAPLVQIFWPLMIQSPEPSSAFTARVRRPARSEPLAGSEKSWHQISSPLASGGRSFSFHASLAQAITVGPHMP